MEFLSAKYIARIFFYYSKKELKNERCNKI